MKPFEQWVATRQEGSPLSQASEQVYRAMWRSMSREIGKGEGSWGKLTSDELQAALDRLCLGRTVRRRYLQLVARVIGEASPAHEILAESDVPPRPLPQHLPPNEEAALSSAIAAEALRNQALIQLYLGAGLRTGEAVRLSREDLFLDAAVPWVAVRNRSGVPVRAAPLSATASRALVAWLRQHDDHFVFPGSSSEHLDEATAWRICTAFARAASNADSTASPRRLRNAFAVRQLDAGERLSTVADWIGHRSTQTTERLKRLAPPRRQPV